MAYSLQLDLSSCGHTPQEAREMLRKAVKLFTEEAQNLGTLEDILLECGYKKEKEDLWNPPPICEFGMVESH